MHIILRYEDVNDKTLAFAARETADYLGRMLPDTPVTICSENISCDLEQKEQDSLSIALKVMPDNNKTDHFDIRISDQNGAGVVTGNHSRSVLMGVYHYLYLLGCRFLGPVREMEVVPVLTDMSKLYQQVSHTASYYHRGVCIEGSESLENVLNFINWLPKIGYNAFFIQFQIPYTFLARWYHHEGNPLVEPEEFTARDAEEYTRVMVTELKKRDLLLQQVGHGWTGESIGIPTMDWKETDYILTDKQRSMLVQLNGKRDFSMARL